MDIIKRNDLDPHKMNILNISSYELSGGRFNGYVNHLNLIKEGINSKYLVWKKEGNDPNTEILFNSKYRKGIQRRVQNFEYKQSIHSVFYPFAFVLPFKKTFRKANVVHYHLIHNYFFSLLAFPLLTWLKPTVWTLHDPWAITGHCIYPRDCEKWTKICENCPNLSTHFPMIKDNTKKMWKLKKMIYRISRFEIVVASNWMFENVERSLLFKNKKIHYIPFGIDFNTFYPRNGSQAKAELGINKNFTILFRANNSEFKGFNFIKAALIKYSKQNKQKINVLTVEQSGLLDDLKGYFDIKEYGWVHDQDLMNLLFNAADVFLMPSTAEAFGLMAVEAMSCAKPVIVFKGTALPEIVNAPECGIAVDISSKELYEKIIFLMENESYRNNIGSKALEFAQKNYNYNVHYSRIKNLYNEISKR